MKTRIAESATTRASEAAVDLRVALVHDWLTGMRGGERVLLELCRIFPRSRVYTLHWKRGSVHAEIESRVAQTSFLTKLSAVLDYRFGLPLFPAAVRSLDVQNVDLVVSSSHAMSKGVRAPEGVPHVSYIHTPPRYLWGLADSYFAFGRGRRWKRLALSIVTPYLRRFDFRSAQNVDLLIANSTNVSRRVERIYCRSARVVYPPIDTDFFQPDQKSEPDDYYLVVSALEPYKRIDLAIGAFRCMDRKLLVAGTGTQESSLRSMAPDNVRFLGQVTDEDLRRLYQRCRGLVFPGIEDFGMTPLEAQACGRGVICYAEGGALESVIDGVTGVYFHSQTPEALQAAVKGFDSKRWDRDACRRQSLRFATDHFRRGVLDAVGELVGHA